MGSFLFPSDEPSIETSLFDPGRSSSIETSVSQFANVVTERTGLTPEKGWNYDPIEFKNESLSQITIPYTLVETAAIATICAVMSLTTIIGNVLVVVAFKVEKQLQTVSNYFLLSLAVADLAIGAISMPFFTLYLLYGYRWPLGPTLCDCWLAIDYTMSNASVANLLIISFDRYFSVKRPLTYRAKRTPKRAAAMIGCAWIISIILWTPWIFSWPYIEGKRTVPPNDCYIQFLKTNSYVTIITALMAFYVPVTIMTFLYYRIWKATEKRKKRLVNLTADSQHNHSKRSTCSSDDESLGTSTNQRWANSSPDISEIDSFTEDYNNHSEKYQKKWLNVLKRCCLVDKEMEDNGNPDNAVSSAPPTATNERCKNDSPVSSCRVALYSSTLSSSLKSNRQNVRSDNSGEYILPLDSQKSRDEDPKNSDANAVDIESEREGFYTQQLDSIHLKMPNKDPSDRLAFQFIKDMEPGKTESEELENCRTRERIDSCSETAFRPHKSQTRKTEHQMFRTKNDDQTDSRISTPGISRKTTPTIDLTSVARQTTLARWVLERIRLQQVKRKKQQGYQEKKAAKILSAILLAFIITWTPYNLFTVFQVFCEDCINGTVYAIGYSLCYLNSTINPLCYALCNVNFRTTFLRILFCRTKRNASYQRTILLQRHRRLYQSSSFASSSSVKKTKWTNEK